MTKRSRGKFIKEILDRYHLIKSGDLVLDVGCGNGGVVSALFDQGFDAIGIDIHEQSINYGKNVLQLPLFHSSVYDVQSVLDRKPKVVLYMFSLEYVEKIRDELAAVRKILRDDGHLVVVGLRLKKSIFSSISLKFTLRFYLVHIFSPRTLSQIARAEGLALVHHNLGIRSWLSRPVNHSMFILRKCEPVDLVPKRFVSRLVYFNLRIIEFLGYRLNAIRKFFE